MPTPLVICIGNVARGDDGVAHAVAEELKRTGEIPTSCIVTATDLDITMAADIAGSSRVVIVDAVRRDDPPVAISRIHPGQTPRPTGHCIDAESLLALAVVLYGHAPETSLISVAAPDMGHSETLSDVARAASREAARAIVSVLETAPDAIG